jgi:hypothetical protein
MRAEYKSDIGATRMKIWFVSNAIPYRLIQCDLKGYSPIIICILSLVLPPFVLSFHCIHIRNAFFAVMHQLLLLHTALPAHSRWIWEIKGTLKLNKYAVTELKPEYRNKHQVSKTFCTGKTKESKKLHKSNVSSTSSESFTFVWNRR